MEVLNIRNMPQAEKPVLWPATEPTFKGLATALVEQLFSEWPADLTSLSLLRVIALGALTHQDYYLGSVTTSSLDNAASQRRTYHVDYRKNFRNITVPLLTLTAKGCICTEYAVKDDGVLRPYWLGIQTITD